MVTQDQGNIEAATPDTPDEFSQPQSENPILSEIDSLNNAGPEESSNETPSTTETQAPVAEAPIPTPGPATSETTTESTPATPDPAPVQQGPSAEEVQRLQQQAQEYEQLRIQASLKQEVDQYKQQLENNGYMPDQAQQAAQQYSQSRQAQVNLVKQAEQYNQHLLGKVAAAEHFAQKYNLGMNDLAQLRESETPEAMEAIAKDMSNRRSMEEELSRLKQAQVPPQRFDNSQGAPDVAPNDSGWLDRYNNGDRSENAQAAARKAAGL